MGTLSHDKARKLRGIMGRTLKTPNDWDMQLCDPKNYVFKTYPRNAGEDRGIICHYVAECTLKGYEYWTLPHKITYKDLEVFNCSSIEDRKDMIRMFTIEALATKAEHIIKQYQAAGQAQIIAAAAQAIVTRGDFKTD